MAARSVLGLRQRITADRPLVTPTPFDINPDPLGTDAQLRGMENARAERQAMVQRSFDEQNPLLATSAITGPLPDPRWAGFFQTLHDAGVNELGDPSGGRKARYVESPGQLHGQSVQPTYMSTYSQTPTEALARVQDTMALQPGSGSIEALRRKTG